MSQFVSYLRKNRPLGRRHLALALMLLVPFLPLKPLKWVRPARASALIAILAWLSLNSGTLLVA
jgi:hypothetical protein